ncbi:MAG: UvrD-helicase domain-containing protein, partial [Acetivibrio sp.]
MKYNNSQKEAIDQKEGPVLVLAGPGSGKTTVITQRIVSLIEKGVNPRKIL